MLQEVDEAMGISKWTLADVRVNREAAGMSPASCDQMPPAPLRLRLPAYVWMLHDCDLRHTVNRCETHPVVTALSLCIG